MPLTADGLIHSTALLGPNFIPSQRASACKVYVHFLAQMIRKSKQSYNFLEKTIFLKKIYSVCVEGRGQLSRNRFSSTAQILGTELSHQPWSKCLCLLSHLAGPVPQFSMCKLEMLESCCWANLRAWESESREFNHPVSLDCLVYSSPGWVRDMASSHWGSPFNWFSSVYQFKC